MQFFPNRRVCSHTLKFIPLNCLIYRIINSKFNHTFARYNDLYMLFYDNKHYFCCCCCCFWDRHYSVFNYILFCCCCCSCQIFFSSFLNYTFLTLFLSSHWKKIWIVFFLHFFFFNCYLCVKIASVHVTIGIFI